MALHAEYTQPVYVRCHSFVTVSSKMSAVLYLSLRVPVTLKEAPAERAADTHTQASVHRANYPNKSIDQMQFGISSLVIIF